MTVSLPIVSAIADTLPIGFYAKRRVPLEVVANAECSTYDMINDCIKISYPQIAKALEKVPEGSDIDCLVRSNLYHEVSHSILTPSSLRICDMTNIFEDERIETLLRNYYHNVDFTKSVFLMNGFENASDIPVPTSAMEAFYTTVRFHVGKPEYLDRVQKIIQAYSDIKSTRNSYFDDYRVSDYYYEIKRLYDDIAKDYSSSSSNEDYLNDLLDQLEKNGISIPSSDEEMGEEEADEANDADENVNGTPARTVSHCNLDADKIFSKAFCNQYVDNNLTNSLEMIINSFNKKTAGGACLNGYSGILNPRNFIYREDYRIFDRSAQAKGSNSFGSFHLNLFIDCSGSFYKNEVAVNALINSLSAIERRNPNFTLDIVHCECGQKVITDKSKRFIKADGGNYLSKKIFEQFRGLQKPNTLNYNIVLFDGDACPEGHTFSAFDTANTTIISDPDNTTYLNNDCKTAKIIITKNYVAELYDNVRSALNRAFR